MEQKRTLWIIAAVGVFLLVVLGAALVVYTPNSKSAQTFSNIDKNDTVSSNGWISLAPSVKNEIPPKTNMEAAETSENVTDVLENQSALSHSDNLKTERVENMTVYAENAAIYNSGKNADSEKPVSETPSQTIINNTTVIDLNPNSTISSDIPAKPIEKKQTSNAENETVKVKSKPVISDKTETNAAKKLLKNEKKSVSESQKSITEKTQYWVQVTALTSKKSADDARNILDENRISADVFTYTDAKKRLFYRVRVGPYSTKSEAEYWKSRISKIDAFAKIDSYVTSTTVQE